MTVVHSRLGSAIQILPFSYWALKLSTGEWFCELDQVRDARSQEYRPFDWTVDLIDTGDILKIKELWLMCPPNALSPKGNTARLPIIEPGTAFQFKVNNLDGFGTMYRSMASIIIGRVTNKEEGTCDCFVWDTALQAMGTYTSSIYKFGAWAPHIAPIGALSKVVLGLSF